MSGFAHFCHLIMTILTGFLWLPIWVISALCSGNKHKRTMKNLQEENNELLRKMYKRDKYK